MFADGFVLCSHAKDATFILRSCEDFMKHHISLKSDSIFFYHL